MNNNRNLKAEQDSLDIVIDEIKKEFKTLGCKRKDLIIKLGNALEQTGWQEDSICEEIKNILVEEITNGDISRRDIERYSPDNWKKKTHPIKKENDKLSFEKNEIISPSRQIIIDTEGKSMSGLVPANNDEKKITETTDSKIIDRSLSDPQNLRFEIALCYLDLKEYMEREYAKHLGRENVWIHGTLNKLSGKIIAASPGRLPDIDRNNLSFQDVK